MTLVSRLVVAVFALWCSAVIGAGTTQLSDVEKAALFNAIARTVPEAAESPRYNRVAALRHDDGRLTATMTFPPIFDGRRARSLQVRCRRTDDPAMWACRGKDCSVHYQLAISISGQPEAVDVATNTEPSFVDAAIRVVRKQAREGHEGLKPELLSHIAVISRTPIGTHADFIANDRVSRTARLKLIVAPDMSAIDLNPHLAVVQPGARFRFQMERNEIPLHIDGTLAVDSHAINLPADRFLLLQSIHGRFALRKIADRKAGQAIGAFIEHFRIEDDGTAIDRTVSEVAEDYQDQSLMTLHLGALTLSWSGDRWLYAPNTGDNIVATYSNDTPDTGFRFNNPELMWYYLDANWHRFFEMADGKYVIRLDTIEVLDWL